MGKGPPPPPLSLGNTGHLTAGCDIKMMKYVRKMLPFRQKIQLLQFMTLRHYVFSALYFGYMQRAKMKGGGKGKGGRELHVVFLLSKRGGMRILHFLQRWIPSFTPPRRYIGWRVRREVSPTVCVMSILARHYLDAVVVGFFFFQGLKDSSVDGCSAPPPYKPRLPP